MSESELITSEATAACPVATEAQPGQQRLIVAAVACVAVVGLVFVGSVGVWALRHRRSAKPEGRVAMQAKAVDEDNSLITETQAQEARDPFLAEGLAETPDGQQPTPPPGDGQQPPQPVVPVTPDVIPTPNTDTSSGGGSSTSEGGTTSDSGGGSDSSHGSESSPPPPSKPAKPKPPSKAELAKLDPGDLPDWVDGPTAADGGITLMGVVSGGRPQAIFEYEGKVHRRRIGDEVAGMTVARIERGQVMLKDAASGGPVKAYWLGVREGSRIGGTRSGPVKTVTPPEDTSSESGEGDGGESGGESSGEGDGESSSQ